MTDDPMQRAIDSLSKAQKLAGELAQMTAPRRRSPWPLLVMNAVAAGVVAAVVTLVLR
jgi:negative regulator of sigma E activity